MWWKRIATVSLVAGMFVSVGASGVGAIDLDPSFEAGDYVLKIPGVGEMKFEVYAYPIEGGKTVTTWVAPVGYNYEIDDNYMVDDDDPDKEAWKDAAGLEIEMKLDKIESDITWDGDDPGVATLRLPGGSIITVTEPKPDGDFTVMASGDLWTAVGSGSDWMVVYRENIKDDPTRFFKVEATADGIEIKAVSGDGFLNYLKEEYEEEEEAEEAESEEVESDDDDSEGAGHGKEKNQGKGKNN